MNEQELDQALRAIGMRHVRQTAPSALRELAMVVPSSTPERRRWLPFPAWRFQSMFSATKFVVAGVIVALFGGFLLSGVLTQQPSDEQGPAAALASASPSPEATANAAPDQSVRSDLLPGVDLEVEEVAPGAYRVLGDGVRRLGKHMKTVAVAADGSVWLEQRRQTHGADSNSSNDDRWRLWLVRLGEPGDSYEARTRGIDRPSLNFWRTDDGNVRIWETWHETESKRKIYDGSRWVDEPLGIDDFTWCMRSGSVAADGACWSANLGTAGPGRVTEGDGYEWFDVSTVEHEGDSDTIGIGLDLDGHLRWAEVDEDGTVWSMRADDGQPGWFGGFVAFDRETWRSVPYDLADDPIANGYVAHAPGYGDHGLPLFTGSDGTIWLRFENDADIKLVGWDGDRWITHGPLSPGTVERVDRLPDGRVIVNGAYVLEGSALQTWNPLPPGLAIGDLAVAPDGSVWVLADENGGRDLYVITPEAVAGGE